jgi:hypothetical protein
MKDGAVCFVEIPVARHALELAPGVAPGMPIGTDVATAQPAAVYLHTADKYRRLTPRLSQEQKGLGERALMASQRPSEPW